MCKVNKPDLADALIQAACLRTAVIVPCAGQGARLGGKIAKQFQVVEGKPVLAYTLACLEAHPRIQRVVLVVPADWRQRIEREILAPYGFSKITDVVVGGETRQASVAQGLTVLGDWTGPVLVHDGVRPLTVPAVFDRVIDSVLTDGTGVVALPVTDALKRANTQGWVQETIAREALWQIQTPQGFWLQPLREAYAAAAAAGRVGTDDAALLEALNQPVRVVLGDRWNLKITYPDDLELMQARLHMLRQTDKEEA